MSDTSKWWFTLRLFALCGALAATAGASPIKYQLKVPNATVHIGAQTYANFPVTFTFVGDDTQAVSGLVLIGGFNISYSALYQGTASVDVNSGPGGSLATAVFAPNQIVVSVDHNNQVSDLVLCRAALDLPASTLRSYSRYIRRASAPTPSSTAKP